MKIYPFIAKSKIVAEISLKSTLSSTTKPTIAGFNFGVLISSFSYSFVILLDSSHFFSRNNDWSAIRIKTTMFLIHSINLEISREYLYLKLSKLSSKSKTSFSKYISKSKGTLFCIFDDVILIIVSLVQESSEAIFVLSEFEIDLPGRERIYSE